MSNPARAPKVYTAEQLALSAVKVAFLPDGFKDYASRHRKVEAVQAALEGLDMDLCPAFFVPKELSVDPAVLNRNGPALALAKGGKPVPRVRSHIAMAMLASTLDALPQSGFAARTVVDAGMAVKVYADGGTECTLGRIVRAYPHMGARVVRPITQDEARAAVGRCGVVMRHLPAHARRPYPLLPASGEAGVSINPHADNGYPVGGKWDTPGAAEKVMGLALSLRAEAHRVADVGAWLREVERTRPWLAALKGKGKADYYAVEKVVEGRMRFYNAFPRPMLLVMQQATQVLELNSRHIQNSDSHSGIGMTLVRGGAADLVGALETQLRRAGAAYVHVGDDSWVVVRRGGDLVMFALDCSNFDLTQHADTTREVHAALRDELRSIEPVAADLWHAYARERVVVVCGAVVRRWRHAGPSGMPLQSKVNDVLMDVMIQRTLAALGDASEEDVSRVVRETGEGMGFDVRLEQYWRGRAQDLAEALEQQPFLFVGYYFHVRGGQAMVCADIPRMLAQWPYPAQKWAKSKQELELVEAMRLGSIMLNVGMPTRELEPFVGALRTQVLAFVDQIIARHGDVNDPKLRWAVSENPLAESVHPSLKGLRRALGRDAGELWLMREPEMPSTSELIPVGLSWADMAEEEEAFEAKTFKAVSARPPTVVGVRPGGLGTRVNPTHPPTFKNDGRPPPTAEWGPPKAPRVRVRSKGGARRHRRWEEDEEAASEWSEGFYSD